jgi:hypothetical protein
MARYYVLRSTLIATGQVFECKPTLQPANRRKAAAWAMLAARRMGKAYTHELLWRGSKFLDIGGTSNVKR